MSTLGSTRRDFLAHGILGAVAGTLGGGSRPQDPAIARVPGRAKRLVHVHFAGGPPQMDLFDPKPALDRFDGKPCPQELLGSQKFAFIKGHPKILGTRHPFARYGQSGRALSTLLPRLGEVVDDLCFVHSMHTEAINHEPGITFFQTGSQLPGRPSFGSWASYGLGSVNKDLPAFVVLISQGFGNMQALTSRYWGSGFLPSEHQGCRLRGGTEPVLWLKDPPGVSREDRRRMLDAVGELNEREFRESLDPEVKARIAQAEMAFRMQMSVPELTDFSKEDPKVLERYGPEVHKPGTFAANCLLARRLLERGVRFVQLYMRGWDAHGNLPSEIRLQCKAVDQPQAALLADLKERGLMSDTLVMSGAEFGRTVYSQGTLTNTDYGRDHHPRAFTVWLAGAGIKKGITFGETDEYGYNIVGDPVSVHDLHATMLHLLGVDHEKLTFRHQGRDFRLTDVEGRVVTGILA